MLGGRSGRCEYRHGAPHVSARIEERRGRHAQLDVPLTAGRDAPVAGCRSQVNGRRRRSKQRFEPLTPRLERDASQIPVSLTKQVEEHDGRWSCLGQKPYP